MQNRGRSLLHATRAAELSLRGKAGASPRARNVLQRRPTWSGARQVTSQELSQWSKLRRKLRIGLRRTRTRLITQHGKQPRR